MRTLSLTLVAILTAAGGCLVQPGPAPGSTVPPPGPPPEHHRNEKGIIYGVVVDASTHQPMFNVGVNVQDGNGGPLVVQVKTDTNGRFETPPLPPGDYMMRTLQNGYASESKPAPLRGGRMEVDFEIRRP